MTIRRRVALASAVMAVLGWIVWQAVPQREPRYQGEPLSFWLKGFDIGYNAPRKPAFDESTEAVRQAGTNAIPTLLRMLRTRDSYLKHTLTRLAQKQHFIQIDYVTADRQRWAARQGFLALGLSARHAIPQLVDIADEENSRTEWNKYATEILDLLKKNWPKDVSEDISNAIKEKERRPASKKGANQQNATARPNKHLQPTPQGRPCYMPITLGAGWL